MSLHEGLTADIARIAQQESALIWTRFNKKTAETLGEALRQMLEKRNALATVEIELQGDVLYRYKAEGASPTQDDWIRRKRNVVHRWQRSSYGVGRILERDGESMQQHHGLKEEDYAAHGGGFPITVETRGCVGSVVLSGLPQREDHELVVAAMAWVLGVEVPALA